MQVQQLGGNLRAFNFKVHLLMLAVSLAQFGSNTATLASCGCCKGSVNNRRSWFVCIGLVHIRRADARGLALALLLLQHDALRHTRLLQNIQIYILGDSMNKRNGDMYNLLFPTTQPTALVHSRSCGHTGESLHQFISLVLIRVRHLGVVSGKGACENEVRLEMAHHFVCRRHDVQRNGFAFIIVQIVHIITCTGAHTRSCSFTRTKILSIFTACCLFIAVFSCTRIQE